MSSPRDQARDRHLECLASPVADDLTRYVGQGRTHSLDICNKKELIALGQYVGSCYGAIDRLILSASGDLEPGMPEAYAHAINCEALLDTVRVMGHHLATGSTIIYVTSHEAHFHGSGESYPRYVRIAASKKAGEIALLAYAAVLSDSGVKLNTTKLLEHWDPGYTARRAPQSVNSRPLRMWPKKS
jgi:3-oxoacyl-[acyl-carrier protein] reductase